jgi:hypothetical protein
MEIHEAVTSPDGRWLVVGAKPEESDHLEILVYSWESLEMRHRLATPGADVRWFRVSPDNRWLAYTDFQSGKREVYVTQFPEVTEGERFAVSIGGGAQPYWSPEPERKELFYRDIFWIYRVRYEADSTFRPQTPEKVTNTAGMVIVNEHYWQTALPQADHFLGVGPTGGLLHEEGQPILVRNIWTELTPLLEERR